MKTALLLTLGFCCTALPAQRLTVVLDPARGGAEDGARLDEHTVEKQVTLELAERLRALLAARDFDVVMTRDADTTVANDARAALANNSKAVACVLLHATAAGRGVHLFTSSLPQTAPAGYAVPWDEAQAAYSARSQRLQEELRSAFSRAKLPVSSGHTWVRPLDNMECPAVALEIAPEANGTSAADHGYQNRIADALAGALLAWRGHADVVQSIVAPPVVVETKPAVAPTPSSAGPATKPVVKVAPSPPKTGAQAPLPATSPVAQPTAVRPRPVVPKVVPASPPPADEVPR